MRASTLRLRLFFHSLSVSLSFAASDPLAGERDPQRVDDSRQIAEKSQKHVDAESRAEAGNEEDGQRRKKYRTQDFDDSTQHAAHVRRQREAEGGKKRTRIRERKAKRAVGRGGGRASDAKSKFV